MNYSLIISTASAIIAASAIVVAFLNYLTSRKLPNENKLFEEKIRSYRSVIAALNTCAAVYIEFGNEYQELSKTGPSHRKAKDEMDFELIKAYYLMEDTINEQMLLVPDEVVLQLENFLGLFNQEDFLIETVKAKKLTQFEEEIDTIFDAVINAMREDLAFEKLNKGLKRRIGVRPLSTTLIIPK